ncbi:hypothetical protein CARUB_v10000498mg, partial [Capsella rubella]
SCSMDSKEVSLPLIHEHLMMPWNDLRKGDCCGRLEAISDGYYCKSCDVFVHKRCGDECSEFIEHPCHSIHTLKLVGGNKIKPGSHYCDLCGKRISVNICYHCKICDFDVDLYCAKNPPPEVIDISETHHHKLTLFKERIEFDCDAKCGKSGDGFSYKCHECDLSFHVDCVWNPEEATHLSEGQPPDYSDGKCRLCGREIDELFYHCYLCNFTLDMHCVLNPPRQSLLELKAHDHQLTLLPRLDSHDHRMSRTSVLGVLDAICGVCWQKMNWTYGGYSCQRCHDYVVHSKCATRKHVLDGKELKGVPGDPEVVEPYKIIDDNTLQYFSHKEHYLRLHRNGFFWEEFKRCRACTHPIDLQSFFGCMECDFILHKTCAEFPRKIWHVLYNKRLSLVTSEDDIYECYACQRMSNGFRYQREDKVFDVICGTIAEPFIHPSHLHHPLYYIPQVEERECNGCKELASHLLTCIEDGCGFFLDFKCATLPQVVMHSIDDYPLSLCYGKDTNGKHWCEICNRETDIKTWFYTCKDQHDSFHIDCEIEDFSGIMPASTIDVLSKSFKVMLNNGVSRPFCSSCKSHCMYPIMLKRLGTSDTYVCSASCLSKVLDPINQIGG